MELDATASAAYRGERPSGASAHPLRMLLGEQDAGESSHSRSKAYHDNSDASDDAYNKKRGRNAHSKDDFVQLPQPMKKHRASPPAPAMPPIINGLLEPPPHAALFPPIASNSFNGSDPNGVRRLNAYVQGGDDRVMRSPEADWSGGKSRKRAAKPRRKWSEEETKHLLLGVNRHGVGKWTSILEDPDFTFNDRTAGDLKDRFRTCCPEELRAGSGRRSQSNSPKAAPQEISKQRAKTGIHSENILIEDSPSPPTAGESDSAPKPRKSRAHRKKLEDLAELGIHGPFKKSHRRERRPFTEQDDREILEGLEIYGPAWTKIQRDARFNLSSRQPTDLRDRVRNKYPSVYHRIEKGTFSSKDGGRSSNVMEPSVNMSIDSALKRGKAPSSKVPRASRGSAKEDLPSWSAHLTDHPNYVQPPQTFDFTEPNVPHLMGGEMDISRLLLDDTRLSQNQIRQGGDYSPESSSPPRYMTESRRDRHGVYSIKC